MVEGYRNLLIRIVTFLGGLYFVVEFLLPEVLLKEWGVRAAHEPISNGFIAVGTAAFALGLINLIMVHGSKLAFLKRGWLNSAALLLGLVMMLGVSTFDWLATLGNTRRSGELGLLGDFSRKIAADEGAQKKDIKPYFERNRLLVDAATPRLQALLERSFEVDRDKSTLRDLLLTELRTKVSRTLASLNSLVQVEGHPIDPQAQEQVAKDLGEVSAVWAKLLALEDTAQLRSKIFRLLNDGLFVSLGAAMFSLLAVYIAAAAYRAFRIRSWESSLMMASALLVMLGQTSFGTYYQWLPEVRQWLMEVPNAAAFRAIRIGAAVGALVMAFRMWLSIESKSFNEEA